MDLRLIGAFLFAILFDIAMPIALALLVRRRLGVSWRYFWYGALIFFLFQIVSRVPAVQLLQATLAEPLRQSVTLQWVWLFALALTAGLFEEGGRYLGYRYLIFRGLGVRSQGSALDALAPAPQPPTPALEGWKRGVMYGLGHGGIESMLLVGGMAALSLINAIAITRLDPTMVAALPPGQGAQVLQAQQLFLTMAWWMPLLGAFERLCTITIQVGFSILVLQCFLRGARRWLYLAIGAHFLVDFVVVVASPRVGALATEGITALFALAALLLVFLLRPTPEPKPA